MSTCPLLSHKDVLIIVVFCFAGRAPNGMYIYTVQVQYFYIVHKFTGAHIMYMIDNVGILKVCDFYQEFKP